MIERVGRNDPCPCGSGKKFKKCCYAKINDSAPVPEELLTGTPFDECIGVMQAMSMHTKILFDTDPEAVELKAACEEFERKYRPGEKDGVPGSIFMNWMLYDLRYGKQGKTVHEMFRNEYSGEMNQRGQYLLERLSQSYIAFYEIVSYSDKLVWFKELYTGKEFVVTRIDEPFEKDLKPGDIWYTRLLGIDSEYYNFSFPYIFPQKAREHLVAAVREQVQSLKKVRKEGMLITGTDDFVEASKMSVRIWMDIFTSGRERKNTKMPVLYNTDRELMQITKLFFIIKKRDGLEDKLTKTKNFNHDEKNKMWIWFKKGTKNKSIYPTVSLGMVSIKDNYLIAETNSIERALRLRSRIENELSEYLDYEKMESIAPDKMPMPSPEELEKSRKEQEELNSKPEVQKALQQMQQNYYLNEWITQRVPALGNISPKQAAKTESGRKKLEQLLNEFESMQENKPVKVDFNLVREKLYK
jgi:hypothetical protein